MAPNLERIEGIEPSSRAWKARALPLDDIRTCATETAAALERWITRQAGRV